MTLNIDETSKQAFRTVASLLQSYYLLALKHDDEEHMQFAKDMLANMKERLPDECFPNSEE